MITSRSSPSMVGISTASSSVRNSIARRTRTGVPVVAAVDRTPEAGLHSGLLHPGTLGGRMCSCGSQAFRVVCQSPYEAVGVLAFRKVIPERWRPRVQVEIHGDWRSATRLCGSAHRRWLSRVSDGLAGWAVRNADRVRVVNTWLAGLARDAGYRGAIESHIAFSDYTAFYAASPAQCRLGPCASSRACSSATRESTS